MALVHPRKASLRKGRGELHPAIALLSGFGLLVCVAVAVHALFSLI